jgi:hypothetical protein
VSYAYRVDVGDRVMRSQQEMTNIELFNEANKKLQDAFYRPEVELFRKSIEAKVNKKTIQEWYPGDSLEKEIAKVLDATTINHIEDYFNGKLRAGEYPTMVTEKDITELRSLYEKSQGKSEADKKQIYAPFYAKKFAALPVSQIMKLSAEYNPTIGVKGEDSQLKGGVRNQLATNISDAFCLKDANFRIYQSYLNVENSVKESDAKVENKKAEIEKSNTKNGVSKSIHEKNGKYYEDPDDDLNYENMERYPNNVLATLTRIQSSDYRTQQELIVTYNKLLGVLKKNNANAKRPAIDLIETSLSTAQTTNLDLSEQESVLATVTTMLMAQSDTGITDSEKNEIQSILQMQSDVFSKAKSDAEKNDKLKNFAMNLPSQRALIALDAAIARLDQYIQDKENKDKIDGKKRLDRKLDFARAQRNELKKLRWPLVLEPEKEGDPVGTVRKRVLEAQNLINSPTLGGKSNTKEQSLVSLFDSTLQKTDEQNLEFLKRYKQEYPIEPEGINSLGDVLSVINELREILINYKKGSHANYKRALIRSGAGLLTPDQKMAIINPLISYLNNAEAGLLTGRYSDPKIVLDQCMSELIKGIKDTKSKTLPNKLEEFNKTRKDKGTTIEQKETALEQKEMPLEQKETALEQKEMPLEQKEKALEQIEILLGSEEVTKKKQLREMKKKIENDEELHPIASIQKYASDEKLELKTRQDMIKEFDDVKVEYERAYETAKKVAEIFKTDIARQKLVPNYIDKEKLEDLVREGIGNSNFFKPLEAYVANEKMTNPGTIKPKFAEDDLEGERLINIYNIYKLDKSPERKKALVDYYVDLYSNQDVIETMNEDYSFDGGRNPVAVAIQEELKGNPDCLAYIEVEQLLKRIDPQKIAFEQLYNDALISQNEHLSSCVGGLKSELKVMSEDITQQLTNATSPEGKAAFRIRAALYNAAHQFEAGNLWYELIEEQKKYKNHEKLSVQEQIQKFEEINERISKVVGSDAVLPGLVEVLEALKKEHTYAYSSKSREDNDISENELVDSTSQPTASEKSDQGISVAHNNYLNNIKMLLAAIKPTFSSDENLGEKIEKIISMNSATEDDFDEVVKLTQEIVTNIKQKNVNTQNLASLNHILDSVRAELEANQQATNSSLVNKF